MNEAELGVLVGMLVILISFTCGIVLIAASMRSSQISQKEEERDEQNSERLDQRDY